MLNSTVIFLGSIALVLTFVILPLIKKYAIGFGIVDKPEKRKIHSGSIPRLGGIAVFVGWYIAILVAMFGLGLANEDQSLAHVLLFGAPLSLLLGLCDDFCPIGAKKKLVGQLLIGLLVYILGFRVESLMVAPGVHFTLGLFSAPLTMLWVASIMNAINLIDGMDGLAGGISAIAFFSMSIISYLTGNISLFIISSTMFAALLAFLWFNFFPAKIFMGDSGSMFLGFMLAVLSLSFSASSSVFESLPIPISVSLCFLLLPLLDMGVTITRRIVQVYDEHHFDGEPITTLSLTFVLRRVFSADDDHIHHRLLGRGWSQPKVVLFLYSISLLANGLGFLLVFLPNWLALTATVIAFFLLFEFILSLDYLEFAPRKFRMEQRSLELAEAIGQSPMLIRRVSSN